MSLSKKNKSILGGALIAVAGCFFLLNDTSLTAEQIKTLEAHRLVAFKEKRAKQTKVVDNFILEENPSIKSTYWEEDVFIVGVDISNVKYEQVLQVVCEVIEGSGFLGQSVRVEILDGLLLGSEYADFTALSSTTCK